MELLNKAEQRHILGGEDTKPHCTKTGDILIRNCDMAGDITIKNCVTVEGRCNSEHSWNDEEGTWSCGKFTLNPQPLP